MVKTQLSTGVPDVVGGVDVDEVLATGRMDEDNV